MPHRVPTEVSTYLLRTFLPVILLTVMIPSACRPTDDAGPPSADLVISNATVVDVESGEAVPGRTIFVEGNRIVAVRPTAESAVPEGAELVDASGLYAIPGLWDAHVHSAAGVSWHFPLFVAHGVTSVRNLHTTVDTALESTKSIKRRVASGELLGPRFLANGPIIDGSPPSWPGSVVATTPEEGRTAVDSLAAGGADFIKVYDKLLPEVYRAIAEAASERGIPVDGHVPMLVTPEAAAAAGQRTVEHTSGITMGCSTAADSLRTEFRGLLERLPSMSFPRTAVAFFTLVRTAADTRDTELCARTARAYREHGVVAVPTLSIGPKDPKALVADSSRMSLLPPDVRGMWTEMAAGGPGPIDAVMNQGEWTAPPNTRLMHEAGVPILAGTDVGNPFLIPGLSLHEELTLLVEEAGLAPLDALQAATIEPARTFGLTDSLGLVAPGQLADLVLLEGNPLEDIHATTSIAGVVLDGRYLDRAGLDGLLVDATGGE